LDSHKTYAVIHTTYRGYYHWLLESLPRLLHLCDHSNEFSLILPVSFTEPFYAETLQLLGVSSVIRVEPRTIYSTKTIVLPYLNNPMGTYSRARLLELRRRLLRAASGFCARRYGEKIYITRKSALRRKVINEAEVENALSSIGFVSVILEDYSVVEQAAIFSEAKLVIGIHGAGLSNILFLPENSILIELRKFDGGENSFFQSLAAALNQKYHLMYCDAVDAQKSVQDADIRVDVEALTSLVRQVTDFAR
jgi:capsular polysaccharide biosynthesis protein